MIGRRPRSPLFPYTTLFRSRDSGTARTAIAASRYGRERLASPSPRGAHLYSCRHTYASPLRPRSEEHTSELQSRFDLVCRLLLEKKNAKLSTRSTSTPQRRS